MTETPCLKSPAKNIILIGFMGCGKSTIGRELSKSLCYPLVDTDHIIEERESKSIPEIFKAHDEAYFRRLEHNLLIELSKDTDSRQIISTGGGLPIQPGNGKLLKEIGYVVWLQSSVDTILERTEKNSNRPLLQCSNTREKIEELLTSRTPIYEKYSHLSISTEGLSVNEVAQGILDSARYFFSHIE